MNGQDRIAIIYDNLTKIFARDIKDYSIDEVSFIIHNIEIINNEIYLMKHSIENCPTYIFNRIHRLAHREWQR